MSKVKISYYTDFDKWEAMVNDVIVAEGMRGKDIVLIANTVKEAVTYYRHCLGYAEYCEEVPDSGVVLYRPVDGLEQAAQKSLRWIVFGAGKEGLAVFEAFTDDSSMSLALKVDLLILTEPELIPRTESYFSQRNLDSPASVLVRTRVQSQVLMSLPEFWEV